MRFKLNTTWCLFFLVATGYGVLSYVIPEEAGDKNAADPFVSGCNATKSCFLVPDSCLTTGSCRAGVAVAATGDHFQFEMMAVDSVYVAVGLSDDAFMGKDSVVECVYDADAAEKGVQIFVSFNVGTSNTRIQTSAAENGVNMVTGSYVDGVVRCTFTRDNTTKAEGFTFDLVKRQYHLLVAAGSKLHTYGIAFHDREASGSRNGRLMANVGMFVNPNSETSTPEGESSDGNDAAEKVELPNVMEYEMDDDYDGNDDYLPMEEDNERTTKGSEENDKQFLSQRDDPTEIHFSQNDLDSETANETESVFPVFDNDETSGSQEWDASLSEYDDPTEVQETYGCEDYYSQENFDGEAAYAAESGFTVSDCNVTKSCFLIPPSCLHTDECTLAASVRQTKTGFEFEIHATGSVYVAVALSTDAIMGSDSVVECVTNGSNIAGFTSWNKGHKNHRIHEPLSKTGIALIEGSANGGKVYCKFARDPITAVEGVVFDLTKNKFHLLMASGSRLKAHGIGFHDRGYAGSYDGRLLGDVGMFAQKRRRDMIDESEEDDADLYELADAFRPIVTIV